MAKKQQKAKTQEPKEPAKRGPKSTFSEVIGEKIIQLCIEGKTDQQIADIIGVHVNTLRNWQGKNPQLLWAVREAKINADDLVEASLFSRAVGYSHQSEKIFCHEGVIIKEEFTEHYPPDTKAAQFWLQNRRPDRWRISGDEPKVNVTLELPSRLSKARERAAKK